MGTRHLTAVIRQEKPVIAQYGQWDGYPSGQGLTILDFLHNADLAIFNQRLDKCRFTSDEEYGSLLNSDIPPEFSRDTGADILNLVYEGKAEVLINSWDFAADSLFCEWCYVIDLDKGTFEVYRGFNSMPVPEGERFASMAKLDNSIDTEYYPVKHYHTFQLSALPTENEFLAVCKDDEE